MSFPYPPSLTPSQPFSLFYWGSLSLFPYPIRHHGLTLFLPLPHSCLSSLLSIYLYIAILPKRPLPFLDSHPHTSLPKQRCPKKFRGLSRQTPFLHSHHLAVFDDFSPIFTSTRHFCRNHRHLVAEDPRTPPFARLAAGMDETGLCEIGVTDLMGKTGDSIRTG